MNYLYCCQQNKEGLRLSIVDPGTGNEIWLQKYPAFTEDKASGELVEDLTLIDYGVMNNIYDTAGVEKYLKSIGVISESDGVYLDTKSIKLQNTPSVKLPEGVTLATK